MLPETQSLGSLRGAVHGKKVDDQVWKYSFNRAIRDAWIEWGEEASYFRNYLTHEAPFGGWTIGWQQSFDGEQMLIVLLPDRGQDFRGKNKRELSYLQQLKAHEVSAEIIERVDCLMNTLLASWPEFKNHVESQ